MLATPNSAHRVLLSALLAAPCALAPAAASASFPAGVWGLVEKVTPEGEDRVRIDGLFMVANLPPEFAQYIGYSEPAYGYMYYQCPPGQLAVCAMEWADLAAAAASDDDCRGWGDQSLKDNGTVRPYGEPVMPPTPYPISMGVLVGVSPCNAMRQWMNDNPPPAGDTTGGGTEGSTSSDTTASGDATAGDTTAGDATAGDATAGDATAGDATAGDTAVPGDTAEATAGATTSGTTTSPADASTGDANSAGETSSAQETGPKDAGCGCRTDDPGRPGLAALAFASLLALRRRRPRGA